MKSLYLGIKALIAFVKLVRDPNRLEEVFKVNDGASRDEALRAVVAHVSRFAGPRLALRSRPRLPEVALERLSLQPPGTLGKAFADHMVANGLDPGALPSLSSSNELEFVNAHLYETHDIWHVVTGFETDVAGELGLQAFYAAQTRGALPLILISAGLLNTLFFARGEYRARFEAIAEGWRLGLRAKPFFGMEWGKFWGRPLSEIREELEIQEDLERITG